MLSLGAPGSNSVRSVIDSSTMCEVSEMVVIVSMSDREE